MSSMSYHSGNLAVKHLRPMRVAWSRRSFSENVFSKNVAVQEHKPKLIHHSAGIFKKHNLVTKYCNHTYIPSLRTQPRAVDFSTWD